MQCPIPVEGGECGADAKTQSAWISQRDESVTIHFNCAHGHCFHIDPRERWQVCRCHVAEKIMKEMACVPGFNTPPEVLLETLSAQKGIQIIVW